MSKKCFALVLVMVFLIITDTLLAKKLYFPRLEGLMLPEPGSPPLKVKAFADEFIGIAFTNKSQVNPLAITMRVYNEQGVNVITRQMTLNPREQRARLGTELFGQEIRGKKLWMVAETSHDEVASFFMIGDQKLNLLDGGVALTDADLGTDIYIPAVLKSGFFYFPTRNTEVSIINPGLKPGKEMWFSHAAQSQTLKFFHGLAFVFVDFNMRFDDTFNGNKLPPYVPSPRGMTIELYDSSGKLVASTVWNGLDRRPVIKLLSELLGVEEAVGGYVRLKSDQEFYAVSIFGHIGSNGQVTMWSIIPGQ